MKKIWKKIKVIIYRNRFLHYMYKTIFILPIDKINRFSKSRYIKKKGFKVLSFINRVLGSKKYLYFIDFGTLLGIVRSNDFIKSDIDIDIGLFCDDENEKKLIASTLLSRGCKLESVFYESDKIREHSLRYMNIKFDINYYYSDASYSYCYLFFKNNCTDIPDNIYNVAKMRYKKINGVNIKKLRGVDIHYPNNYESLLEEKYGTNWRIPDEKWVYWKSPAVITESVGYKTTKMEGK